MLARVRVRLLLIRLIPLLLSLFLSSSLAQPQTLYTGHALLRPLFKSNVANTNEPFLGYANFTQTFTEGISSTTISLTVRGLQAGKSYGLHVHAWGDLSSIFNANGGLVDIPKTPSLPTVGGHFDVMGRGPEAHGCKDNIKNKTRHTGDIGVVRVAPNTTSTQWVTYTFTSELLDLGANGIANDSIIGRSLVLHENPDPCYQVGAALGNWVGLGLIGINWVPAGIKQGAGQERTLPITTQANALVYNFGMNTNVPVGNLRFWTDTRGILRISGSVSGFDANSVHGVHIHAFGNEDTAAASGPHFGNGVIGLTHGLPPATNREYGDLGNMMADTMGVITFDATKFYNTELVSLYLNTDDAPGTRSIIGRAIVFHALADDGNMFGGRTAAGVIGLVNAATPRPSAPPSMPPQASAYVKLIPYYSSSIANTDAPLIGSVLFTQNNAGGVVNITVTVSGLRGGRQYGMHVHQWGDLSGMFDLSNGTIPTDRASFPSVAGHFNPFNQPHGCSNSGSNRHVGDIGNLVLPAEVDPTVPLSFFLQSELLDLGRDSINNNSIIGRAIVLHEQQDRCVATGLGNWIGVGTIGINNAPGNSASQDRDLPSDTKANAAIFNTKKGATGNVWFWSDTDGAVHMSGMVSGFAPNSQHGVHIHQFANEDDHDEMHPNEESYREVGDLGHLLTADEQGVVRFTDLTLPPDLVSLTSMSGQSIIGRSIEFHDFDPTGSSSGTAYQSSMMGVIGLADSSSISPIGPSPSNPILNSNDGSSLLIISSSMHMYIIVHMSLSLVFLSAFWS